MTEAELRGVEPRPQSHTRPLSDELRGRLGALLEVCGFDPDREVVVRSRADGRGFELFQADAGSIARFRRSA